jgi:hypothetical protein
MDVRERKDEKISGRLSVGAIRELAKAVYKKTRKATCIEITFWAYETGSEEENISLWVNNLAPTHYVKSVAELRTLIENLTK